VPKVLGMDPKCGLVKAFNCDMPLPLRPEQSPPPCGPNQPPLPSLVSFFLSIEVCLESSWRKLLELSLVFYKDPQWFPQRLWITEKKGFVFYSLLRESKVGCIGALGLSGFLTM
jgi:hypothetical protein